MMIDSEDAAREFVASWDRDGRSVVARYRAVSGALDGQRARLAIERVYRGRYDQTGTLGAIRVLDEAQARLLELVSAGA